VRLLWRGTRHSAIDGETVLTSTGGPPVFYLTIDIGGGRLLVRCPSPYS